MQLDKTTPLGTDIKEVVGLDDYIFDIAVTSNRPDCQSIYGIAPRGRGGAQKAAPPVDLSYKEDNFSTTERVNVTVGSA